MPIITYLILLATCTIYNAYNIFYPLQIALFVQFEKKKKVCLLFGCCKRHRAPGDDHQDNATAVDTNTRSVELSYVTVTPHSRMKTLSYVVGVDSISTLISDFEQHSVRGYPLQFTNYVAILNWCSHNLLFT